mgnify:CR=1 FL=1
MPIQPGIPRARFLPEPLVPFPDRRDDRRITAPREPAEDVKFAERVRIGFQRTTDDMGALRKRVEELEDYQRVVGEKLNEIIKALADVDDALSRRLNEILLSGALADRPTAGIADRFFFATDQAVGARLVFDDGSNWLAP